ncbi:hypothetical protein CAG64_11060 [Vibrio sp. V38_P2S17PM301]|uniref:hypothetical protein n=1 Tax=Vibrio sp. V38_P2S17PM301 TaxID=1938689 RepID=UPI001360FE4E|nr:hypothetical protein [Vibrio sp. V38_P2S17PM301]NAX25986.1 hypothetical protein [Vibrio sp. V38_P2S17PM301]
MIKDIEEIHGYHDTKTTYWLCQNCGHRFPVPFDGAGHVWFPPEWENTCCSNTKPKAYGL